jgi:hypothetical protein
MCNLKNISKIIPIEVFNLIDLIKKPNKFLIDLKNELIKDKKVIEFKNKKIVFDKLNKIK